MIKLLLADDHPVVRNGLKAVLHNKPDITVIGEASNGLEAIEMIQLHKPDIVIADISMPVMSGIELLKQLKKLDIVSNVIILSVHDDDEYIIEAVSAGASGYLRKDSGAEELLNAIYTVAGGKKYLSAAVSEALISIQTNFQVRDKEIKELRVSDREREIIKHISKGLSNKQIADILSLSTRTVDAHRYNVMKKLKTKNTAELIQKAIKLKIV